MVSYDVILRGGTIVDGYGGKPFVGDIGVKDGLIAAVSQGRLDGTAQEEMHVDGNVVAPGWVDVHTHLDAQITWDPTVSPVAGNGVTTVVIGNCGVGFAPCRKENRRFLMELMQGVEDIPLGALDEGMVWDWETFPEFLDALDRRQFACDVAAMVGHGPVRTSVLGDRANWADKPGGPAKAALTDSEISQIAEVVREAIAAGAVGFSTSRTILHRDKSGTLVPGTLADQRELLAIGQAVADGGGGLFELATDMSTFDDEAHSPENHERRILHFAQEWGWMQKISKGFQVPVCLCLAVPSTDERRKNGYRTVLQNLELANAQGCEMYAQVFTRPQALLFCWRSQSHPFMEAPTFLQIWADCRSDGAVDLPALMAQLSKPENREAICREATALSEGEAAEGAFGLSMPSTKDEDSPGNMNGSVGEPGALTKMILGNAGYVFRWQEDYCPRQASSLSAVAADTACPVAEVLYDWMCENAGSRVVNLMMMNYHKYSVDDTLEMLEHPYTVPGIGDTGAHLGFVTEGGSHTSLLRVVAVEKAVKMHAADTAALVGMNDRGVLSVGKRADINVIDLEKVSVGCPEYTHDLPRGSARWVQKAFGYHCTLVSGVATFRNGEATGHLPGRLVRNKGRRRGEYPYATAVGRAKMGFSHMFWGAQQAAVAALARVAGPERLENFGLWMVDRGTRTAKL